MAQHPLMSYVYTQEDYCLALKKLESQSAITLSDSCISLMCFAAITQKYTEPLPICLTENHKCNVHSIPDFQLTNDHAITCSFLFF